jgi:hypothetical protein
MFGSSSAAFCAQLEKALFQALTAPTTQYKHCHGKLS